MCVPLVLCDACGTWPLVGSESLVSLLLRVWATWSTACITLAKLWVEFGFGFGFELNLLCFLYVLLVYFILLCTEPMVDWLFKLDRFVFIVVNNTLAMEIRARPDIPCAQWKLVFGIRILCWYVSIILCDGFVVAIIMCIKINKSRMYFYVSPYKFWSVNVFFSKVL